MEIDLEKATVNLNSLFDFIGRIVTGEEQRRMYMIAEEKRSSGFMNGADAAEVLGTYADLFFSNPANYNRGYVEPLFAVE